jgi:predicted permease
MRPVIRTRFGRRTLSADVDAELAFHLEMRERQLMQSGLPPDDARREARRQFGDVTNVRDTCITYDSERIDSMNRVHFLQDLRQDLAYAFRTLRRTPVVSLVVILTLASGIGANTAIFSLVNAVLLRKLDVRAPDELVILGDPTRVSSMGFDSNPRADLYSYVTYRQLAADTTLLTGLAAAGRAERIALSLDGSGEAGAAEQPRGRVVSGNYFSVLDVPAFLGRTFHSGEDDVRGGAPAAVISHGYWLRRFAGDSSIIGRDILINGARFSLVGVAAAGYAGEIVGLQTDIWLPIAMREVLWPQHQVLEDPQAYWLQLIGRRRAGVSLDQVSQAFTTATRRILASQAPIPALVEQAEVVEVPVMDGARGLSRVRTTYRAPLLILMAGVGLLLLIICANVANILLARAAARVREMSVRLAIGAVRGRLVRQLLTESLLLAALGAAAGLALSGWMTQLLLVLAADGGQVMPLKTGVGLPALAFTTIAGFVAVLVFGLMPALRTSGVDVATAMRASGKSLTGSGMGHRNPLGRLLIAAQVSLSLILIVGAMLLVRSLQHLQRTDTGMDRDRLLIVDVDAASRGYEGARLIQLGVDLTARLAATPGVIEASFNENGIFTGTESAVNVGIPGFEVQQRSDSISYYDQAGPGFVSAVGGRLLRGREFNEGDREGSARVVLINESFAKHYYGQASPVGRSIRLGDSVFAEVVGVVRDIKDHALVGAARRRFYVPYLQQTLGAPALLRLVVRTSGDPAVAMPEVRKAVGDVPLRDLIPLSRLMRDSISEERLMARLAVVFGIAALVLAAIGLYGVMSYAVSRRAGEIGLRVALGADRRTVVGMILRDALALVGLGVLCGIPLTLLASRVIRGQLHGVDTADPIAFGVALGVLAAGAIAAALVPAWRAARVEPVVALRAE